MSQTTNSNGEATEVIQAERRIVFSPPDIGEEEIAEVIEALRSGWITTGPRTKQLEKELVEFTGADGVACLASGSVAMECALRALGIGPGDEVITSAYTYTASASAICHVGATPVLCDIAEDSFEMDYDSLARLVTTKTKAIIPVDLGGIMCDYDKIFAILESVSDLWSPASGAQSLFDRVIVLADAAHALGASYKGDSCGSVADFTAFSFHAVKNFTTAEGGALAWRKGIGSRPAKVAGILPPSNKACAYEPRDGLFDTDEFYQQIMLLSLHGQNKDALAKTKLGAWEYDIAFPGWKCNMTDIQAGLGLIQLKRYPGILARRRELIRLYFLQLSGLPVELAQHYQDVSSVDDGAERKNEKGFSSSGHLLLVRLTGKSQSFRNELIERMAKRGIATNVHYKPLPLLTAYKEMGFCIEDFPNAYSHFENEITLPLHTLLADEDVAYVTRVFREEYFILAGK